MPWAANRPVTGPATHWPAVWAAVACGVAVAVNVGKVPPSLPLLRDELGLSLVQAGWVSSMLTTLAVIGAVAMGVFAARLGALRTVMAGLLLSATASLLAFGSARTGHGYVALIGTRLLEGAGMMAVVVAAPGLVSVAAGPGQRRFALSLWSTYMPAGAGLAMALSPWVLPHAGWRGMWLLSAAGLMLAAILTWQQRRHYAVAAAADGAAAGVAAAPSSGPTALSVLRQATPWLLSLAFGLWASQHFALIVWLPSFLVEQRGMGPAGAAMLTCAMLLSCLPGNLLGGVLVQRGLSRGVQVAGAHTLTGLCAIGIFVGDWPDGLRYALCLLLSFAGGLIPSAALSVSAALAKTAPQIGVLQGLMLQGSQLGQFIGTPLIAAAVVAAHGDWTAARGVMVVAAALGVALGLAVLHLERRPIRP